LQGYIDKKNNFICVCAWSCTWKFWNFLCRSLQETFFENFRK